MKTLEARIESMDNNLAKRNIGDLSIIKRKVGAKMEEVSRKDWNALREGDKELHIKHNTNWIFMRYVRSRVQARIDQCFTDIAIEQFKR